MAPRLSGQTSIFGVVFLVSKSLLGIERQNKLEKFAILSRKPRSYAWILIYRKWAIVSSHEKRERNNRNKDTALYFLNNKKKRRIGRGSLSLNSVNCLKKLKRVCMFWSRLAFSPINSFLGWTTVEKILFNGSLIKLILFVNIVSNNAVSSGNAITTALITCQFHMFHIQRPVF